MNKKHLVVIVLILLSLIITTLVICFNRYDTKKLIKAIKNEDVVAVERILKGGVDPNRTYPTPSKLWSFFEHTPDVPLSIACRTGNYKIVKLLIDYGATAEYIENTGWSPLGATLLYYQPEDIKIVELLLENGADPNYKEHRVPVYNAAAMQPKIYDSAVTDRKVLFSSGYDEACAKGITEIVMLILQYDDVDINTDDGLDLLAIAVQSENIYLVKTLLSYGCDPNIENTYGTTAVDLALEIGNDRLIDVLIT